MGRRMKEISGKEDEEEKKLIGLWRVIIFILLLPDGIIETQLRRKLPHRQLIDSARDPFEKGTCELEAS